MKRDLFLKTIALVMIITMLFTFAACAAKVNDEKTIAGILCKDFKSLASKDDPMAIMEALSENEVISFSPVVTEAFEGYLPGFDKDITGFSKGAALMPMIGSIPFAAYCFETEDAKALTSLLSDSVKLDWNICTIADEYKIETSGNLVFIVLAPYEM